MLRWLLFRLFRLRLQGVENLTFARPTVIMPNHVSFADALLLALLLPKDVCFMVNTDIAKRMRWLKKLRKTVAIDPLNPYAIRELVKLVKTGVPLVVFPEGRITITGNVMKLYAGVAFLAIKSEADIVPIWIDGLEYSKFSRMTGKLPMQWFPRVSIWIGASFRLPITPGTSIRHVKEKAVEVIYDHLQQLGYRSRRKTAVNLFNALLSASRTFGSKTPIVEDVNGIASYKRIIQGATALSLLFHRRLPDDTIGVLLPNVTAHIATLFALFRCGKSPAILNFSLGIQAILDNCAVASIRYVITSHAFVQKANLGDTIAALTQQHITVVYLEALRKQLTLRTKLQTLWLRNKPTDSAGKSIILFTSGSEGKPKGVVLSHDNVFANVQQARLMVDCTTQDKFMNALPMFHSFGLTAGTVFPLLCGIPVYTYPSPLHYKIISELIYDRNCTVLFGTSTFLGGYARAAHAYDFRSLRYVFAGAEKLQPAVVALWQQKFGIRILEGYGTTEASPIVSLNTPLYCKAGTVGRLVPALTAKLEPIPGIEQGGKLLLRGDQLMQGYLIHGKGFVPREAWYDTGDVVSIDADGFITIQARLKRFAKIGGEMVSLEVCERIVSRVLTEEKSVVAVVCVVDARKGERIVAYSTEKIDGHRVNQAIQHERLSPLLAPSAYETIAAIPLLGTGKTDYVTLARIANETYGAP